MGIIEGRFTTGGNGNGGRFVVTILGTGAEVGLTGITEGKLILGINTGGGGGVGIEHSAFSAPFSQQYGSFSLFGH